MRTGEDARLGRTIAVRAAAVLLVVMLGVLGAGVALLVESHTLTALVRDTNEAGRQRMLSLRIAASAALGEPERLAESTVWLEEVHGHLVHDAALAYGEVVDDEGHRELMDFLATARQAVDGDQAALAALPRLAEQLLPVLDDAETAYEQVVLVRMGWLRGFVAAGVLAMLAMVTFGWFGVARPDIRALRALAARTRRAAVQQAAIATLGRRALETDDLDAIAATAEQLVAEALGVGHDQIRVTTDGGTDAAGAACVPADGTETVSVGQADVGPDGRDFLRGVDAMLRAAVGRVAAHVQLEHRGTHDALTGLPNRVLFLDRLEHVCSAAARSGEGFAVLILDLDGFKAVNDALGHHAGDALLRQVAGRLSAVVRPGDTLARLGGDEFAVLVPAADQSAATTVAERILTAFTPPFDVDQVELVVTASVGIMLSDHTCDPSQVLREADLAMYEAKAAGRNRAELFHERMEQGALHRFGMVATVRAALADDRIEVAYQPIVELDGARIIGVEALARLRLPDGEIISPDRFIWVAEETGLIGAIGEQVLEQACSDARAWIRTAPAFVLSVNISPRQLSDPHIATTVQRVVSRAGVDPGSLQLEITESALANSPAAQEAIRELKGLGISFAIDDFGTGYNSLAQLRQQPFGMLKIDRSFVAGMIDDPHDRALVAAAIGLAREFGMLTAAEGVESAEQLAELARLGCDYAQGYLWSRPVAAHTISDMLSPPRLTVPSPHTETPLARVSARRQPAGPPGAGRPHGPRRRRHPRAPRAGQAARRAPTLAPALDPDAEFMLNRGQRWFSDPTDQASRRGVSA